MYILIVSRGYPTDRYKTNGIFEFDQAKALAQAGHKVVFACIDMRSIRRTRKFGFESLVKENVHIEAINIPCGRIPNIILNKISIFALKKLYKKIINKYGKPDIIHAHFIQCGYAAVNALSQEKIPIILTEHYSAMNESNISSYYMKLGFFTYSKVNKILSVSRALADNIKDKFNVDVDVVPNAIDISVFEYRKKEKEKKIFYFVSTGNLNINKRMDLLIRSFYNCFNNYENVKLYIFGEGPERNNLEKLISQLQLNNQIILPGLKSREEIADKYSESDCFVLASRRETFGVAYIEAMAMGLAVIATRCGGPEDFVNENNGLLVDADNEIQLSKAMFDVYKEIDRFKGYEISSEIKGKYSPEVIADRLIKIYNEIIMESKNK